MAKSYQQKKSWISFTPVVLIGSLCFVFFGLFSEYGMAQSQTLKPKKPAMSSGTKVGPAKVAPGARRVKKEPLDTSSETFKRLGVGLDLGANATYGNGLKAFFDPIKYLDLQLGAGYNSTGLKLGAGMAGQIWVTDEFSLNLGSSVVRSAGTKGKVSVDGKFTPEGGKEEKVTVSRTFEATPAIYLSPFLGMSYAFTPAIRAALQVNYNKVVSGNEIEFSDAPQYDTPIEATNESEVYDDFEVQAKEKLNINGPGISAGVQYWF